MRIDIVGLPASGKSTLAAAISRKLGIPHIHIDTFWFESGGMQGRYDTPNLEEVRTKVRERVAESAKATSWVSDGTYLRVQDLIANTADVIVFLDIPLLQRLWNHGKRGFFEPKRHSHLTAWDELTFFREIVRRTFTTRPKLLQFISEHKDKAVVIKSHREAKQFLQGL